MSESSLALNAEAKLGSGVRGIVMFLVEIHCCADLSGGFKLEGLQGLGQ